MAGYCLKEYQDQDYSCVKELLKRFTTTKYSDEGYDLKPESCTHVVVSANDIVGAFEYGLSHSNKDTVFRIYWLCSKKDKEGIGTFILKNCIRKTKIDGQKYLYASYNLNNASSCRLFSKYNFKTITSPLPNGEVESRLDINPFPI